MKTITTKTAKNGAQLWYVDGKRTSRVKAAETSVDNGRENLKNLVAGLSADPAIHNDFGIVADMNSEFGERYTEYFYFATAEDAVTVLRKIVASCEKQIHRVTIDNVRPYPTNVRYADAARGKLIFLNGFERFDETADNDVDGFDESAFDLLPTVDELNDTRSDIEKAFDEFDAEYTDRDARFNHGERHAEKLTSKLRKFDPTVQVTYDINEDGEDTFFMTYEGIYGGIYGTLDAAEESFHRLKKNQAENAADAWFNRNDESRENAPVSESTHEVTVWDDGVVTEKPRHEPETVTVKTAEDAWDILDAKFPGKFVISATHTCWDGIKTVTFRNKSDKLRLDVLSDVTYGGAIFQMTVARFDNELEPVFEIEVMDDEPDTEGCGTRD